MKKTFMSMITALLVLLVSAPLAKAAIPYISASAGLGLLSNSDVEGSWMTEIDYKVGYAVSGSVGLDGGMSRIEGAIGYQVNDWDKVNGIEVADDVDTEIAILSFMANGYLDIEMPASLVTPYLMAGVGVANVDFEAVDIVGESDDDTVFAYQVGAGIGFHTAPNITVDVGYRYFATSDIEPEDGVEVGLSSHNIMAGIRVGF